MDDKTVEIVSGEESSSSESSDSDIEFRKRDDKICSFLYKYFIDKHVACIQLVYSRTYFKGR